MNVENGGHDTVSLLGMMKRMGFFNVCPLITQVKDKVKGNNYRGTEIKEASLGLLRASVPSCLCGFKVKWGVLSRSGPIPAGFRGFPAYPSI
jgi:hypothetical protein